jgi:hypothetical protein
MFQRLSTSARRVLFLARAEAGRMGSDWIEPEHLLLGVLAEDQRDWIPAIPAMAGENRITLPEDPAPAPAPFFTPGCAAKLRQMLAASAGTPKWGLFTVPLARRSQRVLTTTAERSERWRITLLDMLGGLMTDPTVGEVLRSVGITVAQIDDAIRKQPQSNRTTAQKRNPTQRGPVGED